MGHSATPELDWLAPLLKYSPNLSIPTVLLKHQLPDDILIKRK